MYCIMGQVPFSHVLAMSNLKQYKYEWIIDMNITIFRNEGREYIDRLIIVGE